MTLCPTIFAITEPLQTHTHLTYITSNRVQTNLTVSAGVMLKLDTDLDILKVYIHTKNEVATSVHLAQTEKKYEK